jgi:Uma2 family endonuclease
MSAATQPRLHTAEDLERLSAEGHRYELMRGELIPMSPAGGRHGSATDRLASYSAHFVYENELGEGFAAETGFRLGSDPDTVLAPDWAFIRKERMPEDWPRGFMPGAPDLALETRSPDDSRRKVAEKIELWMSLGARVVWDLDPSKQRLAVHRAGTQAEVLGPDDTLTEPELLPGFSLLLGRVFR